MKQVINLKSLLKFNPYRLWIKDCKGKPWTIHVDSIYYSNMHVLTGVFAFEVKFYRVNSTEPVFISDIPVKIIYEVNKHYFGNEAQVYSTGYDSTIRFLMSPEKLFSTTVVISDGATEQQHEFRLYG